MNLPSLYTLSTQYQQLEQLLGSDEELDETALQAIHDTLEGLEGDIQVKATNVAAYALNLEVYAQMARDAAKALQARAKRIEHRAEALRGYIRMHMEAVGISKIEGPQFTVAIRKNPPSVQIEPDTVLDPRFLRVVPPPPPAPDKAEIGRALKAGENVPGCSLLTTTRLDIRS